MFTNHIYYICGSGHLATMEFFGQEILGLKIPAQDYHLDDDVLALNNSDSDILATIEKADFVEFLDDDSYMLAGSDGDLDTYW